MAIFIDSSNVAEVEEITKWGIISGATTNPKIICQDGLSGGLEGTIKKIVDIVKGPVSVEVTEEDAAGMVEQAKEFAAWDPENIVIKVPIGQEGLKVVNTLENELGIKTNVTCMMSFNQAYLASLAGATYVSIFFGRIKDMGYDPREVIADTREMIDREELKAQIITGSIRHLMDVNEAFLAGAHIVTITPPILKKMTWNPRSETTIEEFNQIWRDMKKKGLLK
ncbi:MAG: transaldolase family protein [Candidatus Tritonobacter lacicola]|nr:transaldolase family protein [Candidatus Tritonobacter lacicola]